MPCCGLDVLNVAAFEWMQIVSGLAEDGFLQHDRHKAKNMLAFKY
jgi:hypothetical protein